MRWVALVALVGCRSILGIEGATVGDDDHPSDARGDGKSPPGDGHDSAIDAIDAQIGINVHPISCASVTPAAIVKTIDGMFHYNPVTTTIAAGQTVEFRMSALHDVAPDATGSDPGLAVGFGQNACLVFTVSGSYGFHCTSQSFSGSITVQ